MTYIFLLILTMFYGIRTVLDKYFQQGFENGIKSAVVYNLINAIYGAICFFIMGGFRLEMNEKTLIFSIACAVKQLRQYPNSPKAFKNRLFLRCRAQNTPVLLRPAASKNLVF